MNHWSLFKKLLDRNLPYIIVRLLLVWYTTQQFSVQWDSFLSDSFTVTNGVRQGSILSPQLFSIYLEELSNRLSDARTGCHYNSFCFNHLFYADDAVLLAPTVSSLQALINICFTYSVEFDITYSFKKSMCTAFIPAVYKNLLIPSVYLGGRPLLWTNEHKYLGAILKYDMFDDSDIIRQTRSVYSHGNFLIQRFRNCTESVKVKLFKSYCCNMYGIQLWAQFSPQVLSKLRVAYNNIFRSLLRIDRKSSVSAAFIDKNINHFNVVYRKAIYSLESRLLASKNVLVQIIRSSPLFIYGTLNTKWFHYLYIK